MIIQGDCLQKLSEIEKVDVIVTSPPYNIGIKYNTYKDARIDYFPWLDEVFLNINKVMKEDGSFFLNVGSTSVNPTLSSEIREVAEKWFKLQNHIIWVKSISLPVGSFGHFKPINSERYLNNLYEDIYHFTKDGNVKINRLAIGVPYEDKSNINRWQGKRDKRCRGNLWYMPYKTVASQKQHPAGFPVELPENCILLHGIKPDMVVLDPFMGIGTTLLACKRLNVKGIGIELDEAYVTIAEKKLASE